MEQSTPQPVVEDEVEEEVQEDVAMLGGAEQHKTEWGGDFDDEAGHLSFVLGKLGAKSARLAVAQADDSNEFGSDGATSALAVCVCS